MLDFGRSDGYAVPSAFTTPGTPSAVVVWTASPVAGVSGKHWCVEAGSMASSAGMVRTCSDSELLYVYCVRCQNAQDCAALGGPATNAPAGLYSTTTDTVTDTKTRLMWQRVANGTCESWANRLEYCDNLVLAGKNDWRAPSIKELLTIFDETKAQGARIDAEFQYETGGCGGLNSVYWSSTPLAGSTTQWWAVDFGIGDPGPSVDVNWPVEVRCVRGAD